MPSKKKKKKPEGEIKLIKVDDHKSNGDWAENISIYQGYVKIPMQVYSSQRI